MLGANNYIPPPTNAVLYMGGFTAQPVNPFFVCSLTEAQAMLSELLAAGVVPAEAKIADHPEELGIVIYGSDGRHVYCIDFTGVSQPVGMLLAMKTEYANYPWKVVGSGIVKNPTNQA